VAVHESVCTIQFFMRVGEIGVCRERRERERERERETDRETERVGVGGCVVWCGVCGVCDEWYAVLCSACVLYVWRVCIKGYFLTSSDLCAISRTCDLGIVYQSS
jgi:hypothetical protein